MKYLYLIWSNLKRHKLRSVLTMLSILVAFLLFGLLGAIRTAFTAGIDVADHPPEPTHLVALVGDVVAHVGGGRHADLERVGVPPGRRGGVAAARRGPARRGTIRWR